MEIKKNWFYALIMFTLSMLFLLGGWWLYLVFKLAYKLSHLNHPAIEGNLINMVKWEGATFLVLLFILLIALIYFYILDHKKTKAMQDFFASLTHELKTPLASMKLQAQVISEIFKDIPTDHETKLKAEKYSNRLIADSVKLEDQLDNHLQLSRIERNAPLNKRSIDLKEFLKKEITRYEDIPPVQLIAEDDEYLVNADDYALQTIIRNLIENSLTHNKELEKIEISLKRESSIILSYNDFGPHFTGNLNQITDMFYKHNSPKGSGIGLYLIERLTAKMGGALKILNHTHLVFEISLERGQP